MTILLMVGLLTFDELWQAALVPGAFHVVTAMEGYLITPLILGKRMNLSPRVHRAFCTDLPLRRTPRCRRHDRARRECVIPTVMGPPLWALDRAKLE